MPTLFVLIGAPASGKSTVSLYIRQRENAFLTCPDIIRAHFPRWSNGKIFGYAFHRIGQALQRGQSAILDATSANTLHRQRAIAIGHQHHARVVGVWLDTPLRVCLARHANRAANHSQATLTPEIIRRYHATLELNPPTLAEGFDQLIRLNPGYDLAAAFTVPAPPTV